MVLVVVVEEEVVVVVPPQCGGISAIRSSGFGGSSGSGSSGCGGAFGTRKLAMMVVSALFSWLALRILVEQPHFLLVFFSYSFHP